MNTNNILEEYGFTKTREAVHATEYTKGSLIVYTIPNSELNIVINLETSGALANKGKLYHNTALRKFPKRINGGKHEIPYGIKCDFKNEEDYREFLKLLISNSSSI